MFRQYQSGKKSVLRYVDVRQSMRCCTEMYANVGEQDARFPGSSRPPLRRGRRFWPLTLTTVTIQMAKNNDLRKRK